MRKIWQICYIAAIAAPICAGFSFSAKAQTSVDWGLTGCAIAIVTGHPHVAEVTCHNRLTGGVTHNKGIVMLDGQPVEIIATMGPGDEVDQFEVIPPPGYTADPAIDVREGAEGVIRIYAVLMG